jgi:excisionase family DNA binding protein
VAEVDLHMTTRRTSYAGDRLLTVGEVASVMRVSNMTVYRLIKAGHLGAIRVGKNYRIRESDVNSYLSDRAVRFDGDAEGTQAAAVRRASCAHDL